MRNFTQCDSLLLGSDCGAHTVPYIEVKNPTATIEHEATTSKISEDQLFYAMSRGLDQEAAVALIVNGFAREVLKQLAIRCFSSLLDSSSCSHVDQLVFMYRADSAANRDFGGPPHDNQCSARCRCF